MVSLRHTIIPALALVAVSVGLWFSWSASDNLGISAGSSVKRSDPLLHAAGGKWLAQDIAWTEYKGHWRVELMATLTYSGGRRILPREALQGLCGEALTGLPDVPGSVSRKDVYRVELNIRGFQSDGSVGEPLFPYALPVQVRDGACQVKNERGIYYYSYPSTLEGWELVNLTYDKASTSERALNLHFSPIDGVAEGDFPFKEVCEAALADAPPSLAELREATGLPDSLDGQLVRVKNETSVGGKLLSFSFSADKMYRFSDGKCLTVGGA